MAAKELSYVEVPNSDEINELTVPILKTDFLLVEECFLSKKYKKYAQEIIDFEVRDDDVYVCTFPKCGTTWTQEMVWCLMHDLNFEAAKEKPIQERFPFMEIGAIFGFENFPPPPPGVEGPKYYEAESLKFIKDLKTQRCIKTHLPAQLLPTALTAPNCKAKVIYVVRDPRDACVSYYHHQKILQGYIGDLPTFVDLFMRDQVLWAPFWEHVLGYWKIRTLPNVLFITYEEMKKDLGAVIHRVSSFLGKSYSEEQIDKLKQHLSFDSMKRNQAVNYEHTVKMLRNLGNSSEEGSFMRSGQSGDYTNKLTEGQKEAIAEWCKKNLEGSDFDLYKF